VISPAIFKSEEGKAAEFPSVQGQQLLQLPKEKRADFSFLMDRDEVG
jgi:hypothetical protein